MTQEDIEYQETKNCLDMHDRNHPPPEYNLEEASLLADPRDYANSTPVDWDWFSDSDRVETKQLEDYDISVLSVQGGRDYLLKRRIAPTKYFDSEGGKLETIVSPFYLPHTITIKSHKRFNLLLTKLAVRMASFLVHGAARPFDDINASEKKFKGGKQLITRRKTTIADSPKRWIFLDIEQFPITEIAADWCVDPKGAVKEAIKVLLPIEFHNVDFTYQFSGSMGFAKYEGVLDLRVHLFMFLDIAKTSADWKVWYGQYKEAEPGLAESIDASVFNPTQACYVLPPFLNGASDPLKGVERHGYCRLEYREARVAKLFEGFEGLESTENAQVEQWESEFIQSAGEQGFNKLFPPGKILEMFGHVKKGESATEERWLPPQSESKNAGVVVYKETGKIVCKNCSSPLHDKTWTAYTAYKELVLPYCLDEENYEDEAKAKAQNLHHWTRLAMMLKRFALLESNGHVLDLQKPPNRALMDRETFNRVFKNYGGSPIPAYSRKLFTNLWLESPKRKDLAGTEYQPLKDVVIKKDGAEYFNVYHQPDHKLVDVEGLKIKKLVKPFLNHMDYLLPEPNQCDLFISWVAETVHNPVERIQFVPLFIAQNAQGIGRSWLYNVLSKLVGEWNCSKSDLPTLAKGQFQDFLYRSSFCMISEAADNKGNANDRYTSDAAMRERLIDSPLQLNLKYGAMHPNCDVFTNILILTNNASAWKLDPGDNRIWVVENPTVRRSEAYYNKIYKWQNDPVNISALWNYLEDWRETHDFNLKQRAPVTEARNRMIEAGQGDIEHAFRQLLLDPIGELMTFSQIEEYIAIMTGEDDVKFKKELAVLLRNSLKTLDLTGNGRIKISGYNERVWILGDHTLYNQKYTPKEIRPALEEVSRKLTSLLQKQEVE